jgi:hypothetical protein
MTFEFLNPTATRKVLIRMTGPTSWDSWSARGTRSSISASCNIKASLWAEAM